MKYFTPQTKSPEAIPGLLPKNIILLVSALKYGVFTLAGQCVRLSAQAKTCLFEEVMA
jgi:hypothetical protein